MSGSEPEQETPLLFASRARIVVDDAVALDELDLVTRGDRVLFVGDVTALFAALSGVPLLATLPPGGEDLSLAGEARVSAGEMRLSGYDVISLAHLAIAGFAPLDPPIPRTMTTLEYVVWAARLTGASRGAAKEMAVLALRRTGLDSVALRGAATLGLAERRALQLAKAIVNDPPVLVAEAPLEKLEGAHAAFMMGALSAATEGRRALLSARRTDPATAEGALARAASHLVVMGSSGVLAEGSPLTLLSDARLYRLSVAANAEAFALALATRGLTLSGGPVHFTVTLPEEETTQAVLEAASEARAPIIELHPLLA